MRKLVLIPVALSICMSMGGCPKLNDSYDDYDDDRGEEIVYDYRQEFEYEVQDGVIQGGIISDGSGITINPATKPQAPTGEATTPAYAPDSIVGDWVSAHRSDRIIYVTIYTFNADGTYAEQNIEYTHVSYQPEMFYEGATGWQGIPMGFPYYTGTYTLEGNTVTMSCTSDTYEEFNPPIVSTLKVVSFDAESGVFSNEMGEAKYIRNFPTNDPFVENLCAELGIDTTP